MAEEFENQEGKERGADNVGNTGQSGSSEDGKPIRPQPNWGYGGLSVDEPDNSEEE